MHIAVVVKTIREHKYKTPPPGMRAYRLDPGNLGAGLANAGLASGVPGLKSRTTNCHGNLDGIVASKLFPVPEQSGQGSPPPTRGAALLQTEFSIVLKMPSLFFLFLLAGTCGFGCGYNLFGL